jgi:hypothetical protein
MVISLLLIALRDAWLNIGLSVAMKNAETQAAAVGDNEPMDN